MKRGLGELTFIYCTWKNLLPPGGSSMFRILPPWTFQKLLSALVPGCWVYWSRRKFVVLKSKARGYCTQPPIYSCFHVTVSFSRNCFATHHFSRSPPKRHKFTSSNDRNASEAHRWPITTLLSLGWKPDPVAEHIPCSVQTVRNIKRTLAITNTSRKPKKKRDCMLSGVVGEVSFLLLFTEMLTF